MGTISKRTLSDGTLRYRAEIRINRKEYPVYKESKTFSTNKLAEKYGLTEIKDGEEKYLIADVEKILAVIEE